MYEICIEVHVLLQAREGTQRDLQILHTCDAASDFLIHCKKVVGNHKSLCKRFTMIIVLDVEVYSTVSAINGEFSKFWYELYRKSLILPGRSVDIKIRSDSLGKSHP